MQNLHPSFIYHNSRKLLLLLGAVVKKNLIEDLVIQPYLKAAKNFEDCKEFREAIRQCEIILSVDQNHAAAHGLKFKVESLQKEEEERKKLEREEFLKRERIRDTVVYAETSLVNGDFNRSIEHCNTILQTLDPAHEDARILLEKAQRSKREYEERLEREQQEKERKEREEAEQCRLHEAATARKKTIQFSVIAILLLITVSSFTGWWWYQNEKIKQQSAKIEVASKGRFILPQEGIIQDRETGLQWMQTQSNEIMTWDAASSYLQQLRIDGKANWRLPTNDELFGLIAFARKNGTEKNFHQFYNNIGFQGWVPFYYWSSADAYISSVEGKYIVDFTNGTDDVGVVKILNYDQIVKADRYYVRAVRSSQ